MIDKNVIQQLDSPDPQERKKAIAVLARSLNPEALKYLATVVKTDQDPEVADLARKAGIYIRKNAPAQPAPSRPAPAPEPVQDRLRDELTPPPVEVEEREPLPEEIRVSRADEERARGHVEQAISWHMREDNDRAADYLRRAFSANPKLRHDSYTKGLAAAITGLPVDEAVRVLTPAPGELQKRVKVGAAPSAAGATQRLMAFLLLAAAVVLLVAYFLFAWMDISPLQIQGPDGQQGSFGQFIDEANRGLREAREQFEQVGGQIPGVPADQANRLLAALSTQIKISFTGLETTLVSLGIRDIFDVMGLTPLFNVLREFELPGFDPALIPDSQVIPQPLDYTLLLVPIAGILVVIIGVSIMAGSGSMSAWVVSIVIGLIGLTPFWWFFTSVRDQMLSGGVDLSALGQPVTITNISTGTETMGIGFWIGLIAQLLILGLPFIALLALPAPEEAR